VLFLLLYKSSILEVCAQASSSSWEKVQKLGRGDIIFYYRDTEPFIIIDEDGNLSGIEYDLIIDFKRFLKDNYGYDVNLMLERKERFSMVYNIIKNIKQNGTFGLSNISNTLDRQKEVKFSPSYMHDVSVLISSENVDIANDISEYNETFNGLSAVTVLETTYENQLNIIRDRFSTNFPIIYVQNSNFVLETIAKNNDFFGYIDLPNYLLALDKHRHIKRQNILTFKHIGYAIIHPQDSDWDEPLAIYFSNPDFSDFMKKNIEKYLGKDIYAFMETVSKSENESLMLLSREKDIQSKELSRNELILREQRAYRNLFIFGFIATVVVLIVLYNRYKLKVVANEILSVHRKKIENQKKDIKTQNEELESRNFDLIGLNEEKNNLINILSHDLRAPANNIQGLVSIYQMDNKNLTENQSKVINHIKSEAIRLNLMIEKILDIRSLESKKSTVNLDKVNFVEVAKNVSDSFSERAKAKNIVVNFVALEPSIFIKADIIYLKQIIENLISNALKFSHQGTLVTVIISTKYEKVTLEIQDQGPGITEGDRKKMFNKFQRLSAKPTGGEHSTGLGLSIVKKFANEMNAEIWCESEQKKGSNFILEFEVYRD